MLCLCRQHEDSSELFLPLPQLLIHTFAVYLCICVKSWAGTEVAGIPFRCKGEEGLSEGEEVMELLKFGTLAEGLT